MEPRRTPRPHPSYRLLLALLAPLLLGYTAWQALRERSLRYLRERCGFFRPAAAQRPLWLHAASVGELNAALPLIAALLDKTPAPALLVTTATPSSARLAAHKLPPQVSHAFLPLDFAGAIERFLAHFTPRCAVVMETELWPNLFAACARRAIPLCIVNGRLSGRTLHAPAWLRHRYRDALVDVGAILARSEADRDGFLALGAVAERVQVIGNIKFSAALGASADAAALPRPYVLAASTRDGEESLLLQAWQATEHGDRLLVIVPRHPKRLAQILRSLPLPRAQIAVRSADERITGSNVDSWATRAATRNGSRPCAAAISAVHAASAPHGLRPRPAGTPRPGRGGHRPPALRRVGAQPFRAPPGGNAPGPTLGNHALALGHDVEGDPHALRRRLHPNRPLVEVGGAHPHQPAGGRTAVQWPRVRRPNPGLAGRLE